MKNTPAFITKNALAAIAVTAALAIVSAAYAPPARARQSGRQSNEKKGAPAAPPQQAAPLLRRTTTRTETRRVGFGGSVTVYGAPAGSVTVEAWQKGEVEITAEVEISAGTEEELTRLAALNGFVIDADLNHLRVTTVGMHDRKYLKRAARDLPKHLLAMPWKIDYRLRVPASVDLEIYSGRGALSISGVEGALRVSGGEGGASFTLAGGDVDARLTGGPVLVRVPTRSWRGLGMNVRVASGELTVELPAAFSGDVDAEVLHAGRLENSHPALSPRENTTPNGRSLQARAGHGGAKLSFTVGDGTLRIRQVSSERKVSGEQ